jgi:hypothetical protein
MKKRYLLILFAAMLALGLVFNACELFKPGDGIGGGPTQETWEPLVVTGADSDSKTVRIVFTRPAKQALTPSTLKDDDNYEIFHNGQSVSSGTINITGSIVTFIPASGNRFQAAFTTSNGVTSLSLPDGVVPSATVAGGFITGFHTTNGGGSDNSYALAVVSQLDSPNAAAEGGNVVIKGPVVVKKDVTIPAGVKLIFNTRDNDVFNINTDVKVTARGAIEVPAGKGVTIGGDGGLTIEGNLTVIRGKMNIAGGTTLEITGTTTIESGGLLLICGDGTVIKVYNEKYARSEQESAVDAVLKLSGTLAVKNGGRLQLPDTFKFNLKNVTGGIEVEAGGELILLTGEWVDDRSQPLAIVGNWSVGWPKGNFSPDMIINGNYSPIMEIGYSSGYPKIPGPFLLPLIGTVNTETTGVPVGADFVMDPSAKALPSKITMKVNSGVPAFELTGRAIALGRLILEKYYDKYWANLKEREPPFRLEVLVNYPFTVGENSFLQVGNSKDKSLQSVLMVTGPAFYNYTKDLKYGVLTNNGKILVLENSAIMEGFGGYIDHKKNILQYANNSDSASTVFIEMEQNYGSVWIYPNHSPISWETDYLFRIDTIVKWWSWGGDKKIIPPNPPWLWPWPSSWIP